MSEITFKAKITKIGSWTIIVLPISASEKLPSRGMVMVEGKINNIPFSAVLEPDGKYGPGLKPSHWFSLDKKILAQAKLKVGDEVEVALAPTKNWIEPELPEDLREALENSPKAFALWNDITPVARWEWIRWIRAVKTSATREKHIQVALDKLNKGMRRPCCFNRNMCSVPDISNNWVLNY